MTLVSIHSLGHDTGVSAWRDGRLTFSIETERLTRRKHDHRVGNALRYALKCRALDPVTVSLVAVSTNVRNDLLRIPDLDAAMRHIVRGEPHYETTCELFGRPVPCLVVAHEASHAALAVHFGGYRDRTLVLVNEGRGSASRSSLFRLAGGRLEWLEIDPLPWYGNGFGWSAVGDLLGFGRGPSVAGKVMALGGYGASSEAIRERLVRADSRMQTDLAVREAVRRSFLAWPEWDGEFDTTANLVRTFQELFADVVCEVVTQRMAAYDCDHLALGGGCALNLVTNTRLRNRLGRDVAIAPACNDSGQALGAGAYAHAFWLGRNVAPFDVYSNGPARSVSAGSGVFLDRGLRPRPYSPDAVADALARGSIVAWAEGPSEIGPRALGNRSLLADPSAPAMRNRLSQRLKGREWFRPLGAVMSLDRFECLYEGELPSPYMLFAYEAMSGNLDAASHVDGSSRIQTLDSHAHPRLHALLDAFEQRTGVPALINTSLNRAGRAIAQTADDVLDDFWGTDVDLFVFEDVIIENSGR